MKYIKLFENYKYIESVCQKYGITDFVINDNETVDVNGIVNLCDKKLTDIPLKFGKVIGRFDIDQNKISSLYGSPYHVGSTYNCTFNKLNSLEYCPKYIAGRLIFQHNNIYSLDGIGKVGVDIFYLVNPIDELIYLFRGEAKLYLEYLEEYRFQKNNIIYKTRFMDALYDFRITELPELKKYIYQ